jgi:deoxyribodipyrimidine photolyase-related protein
MKRQKHELGLILPTQLFAHSTLIDLDIPLLLWEAPRYFSERPFHKQKLIFHHASMKQYAEYLEKKGRTVFYCPFETPLSTFMKKKQIKIIHLIDPVDIPLNRALSAFCREEALELKLYESPAFLTDNLLINEMFANKKGPFLMHHFYVQQRKRLDILMHRGKPQGGAWSFDKENRQKLPKNMLLPVVWEPKKSSLVEQAITYVNDRFPRNPGNTNFFCYPVTFKDAQHWLTDFLENRLAFFGSYQDAIDYRSPFLFHSVLSPLINTGLLTPQEVLEKTITYATAHKIPLNSLEGFIRQLIGWREYVRALYVSHGEQQRTSNFFEHTHDIPASWWNATTGIPPIDLTIKKIVTYGYAHHIERLMILGNYMLLSEFNPHRVYDWFMELFIDAYDWVMVPNIYGMSQFADGGLMMTKPYISSSNYIRSMSTEFKRGPWCDLWDARFWIFLHKNRQRLSHNSRMALIYKNYARLTPVQLKQYATIISTAS